MTESKASQTRSYRTRLKAERSDRLYLQVLQHLLTGHRYRDPHYTATRLAADLQTNTRYISAAVANSTGDNFNALVNSLRVRDACRMLSQARFDRYTVNANLNRHTHLNPFFVLVPPPPQGHFLLLPLYHGHSICLVQFSKIIDEKILYTLLLLYKMYK